MTRKILFFLVLSAVTAALPAYQPNWVWMQRTYGGGNCQIYSLTTNSQGQIVAAGYIEGEVILGQQTLYSSGTRDGLLAMLDGNGDWLWAVTIGGEGDEYAWKLTLDAQDNIFVAGSFNQNITLGDVTLSPNGGTDIFVAKYDPSGNVLNACSVGCAANDQLGGIAITPTGEVYLAGTFLHSITIGNTTLTSTAYGLFYSKWNAALEPLWAQKASHPAQPPDCVALGSDSAGNLYLVGSFMQQSGFGAPNPIYLSSNNMSGYVVKLSPEGNGIWGERVGSSNFGVTKAYVDPAGNTYLAGDIVIIIDPEVDCGKRLDTIPRCGKLGSNGVWQWYETMAEMQSCVYVHIKGDAAGNAYLSGMLWGSFAFGDYVLTGSYSNENIFVARGNSSGQWQWGLQTYDAGSNYYLGIRDITPLPSGDCVIAGWNRNDSIHFGDYHVSPSTSYYAFFIRANAEVTALDDGLATPTPTRLSAWPNPSRGRVEFRLEGTREEFFYASVHNLKGQIVWRIPTADCASGVSFVWDGYDNSGREAAPGVYILRVETGSKVIRKVFTKI